MFTLDKHSLLNTLIEKIYSHLDIIQFFSISLKSHFLLFM